MDFAIITTQYLSSRQEENSVDPPLLAGAIQGASEVADCVGSKEWIEPFGLLMYCLQKEWGQLGSF